jgi:hypothetical protein
MKKANIILSRDGNIKEEFGGDLSGICCGNESLKLREALKKNGVELVLQNIQCHLPSQKTAEAKENNICVETKGGE